MPLRNSKYSDIPALELSDSISQIARAWQTHQRTFLEQETWKTILYTDVLTSQASLNRILDILAVIPGLLEDTDRFKGTATAMNSSSHPERLSFRKRLIRVLSELFLWRWDWERIHPQVASEIPVNPTISMTMDEKGIPLYETLVSYRGMLQCGQLLLYNTALFRVLELANDWDVQNIPLLALSSLSDRDRPIRSNPLGLPHETLSPAEPVSEICRSIEYCLQDPHAAVGAMSLMLPLNVLLRSSLAGREKRWLSCSTKRIAILCGIELSERVNDHELLAEDMKEVEAHSASSLRPSSKVDR